MENRRKYLRSNSDAIVDMFHPSFGSISVKARDLSEGGISVDMGHHVAPPVGTEVKVVIKRHTGALNAEPVLMRVMHVQGKSGTVGLMFVR